MNPQKGIVVFIVAVVVGFLVATAVKEISTLRERVAILEQKR